MEVAGNQIVPLDGYWFALYGPASALKTQLIPARRNTPERYQAGEPLFDGCHALTPGAVGYERERSS